MKKRLLAIVLTSVLAISTAACGGAQAEPAEGNTPAKTETAAPSEDAAAEASEEKVDLEVDPVAMLESNTKLKEEYIVGGVDFYETKHFQPYEEIIEEQATFDTLKAFVVTNMNEDGERVVDVLSDGDSLICDKEKDPYALYFYTPKKIAHKQPVEGCKYAPMGGAYGDKVAGSIMFVDYLGENEPVGLDIEYEDGTKDSITIYVTTKYAYTF